MNSLSPALTCETLETLLRSLILSAGVGKENILLLTTRCSAAELADNLFCGDGISCYVDLCPI